MHVIMSETLIRLIHLNTLNFKGNLAYEPAKNLRDREIHCFVIMLMLAN